MVESQIGNLTLDLSFGHNLCFRCPNGSCKPILDIYVLIAFQWCKKNFNPMGFDPYNHSLKIWESITPSTPKVGIHLGVPRFNSHTFPYFQPPGSMKCNSWASLLACTFISPCFGCEPKARVVTWSVTWFPFECFASFPWQICHDDSLVELPFQVSFPPHTLLEIGVFDLAH